MLSQYANSPVYVALLNGLKEQFDNSQTLEDWYRIVFNIKTASGYGLDVWGKILNVSRYVNLQVGEDTIKYLEDPLYRQVLFFKAMSNITNCSVDSLNQLLQFFFSEYNSICYVVEYEPMKIRYVFEGFIDDYLLAIFRDEKIKPKPVGVGQEIEFIVPDIYFGFAIEDEEQQFYQTFDNGVFWGESSP